MMQFQCGLVLLLGVCVLHVTCGTTTTLATDLARSEASQIDESDGGLKSEDVAAIVLGILLVCVVIVTIVICILFKKGYIGEQEQTKVIPTIPGIYSTPESLKEFSSAAIDKSHRREKCGSGSSEPIIYLRDDIYHPPNSRPTKENLANLKGHRREEQILPQIHHTKGRSSRKKRESSRLSRTNPDYRKTSLGGTEPYPDNSIFIPEKGGMKFTMLYETQSPYGDRNSMSKTF